ncbi:Murein hydrolase activator NlpD [hydrothermal vent metagenome]|uniref:Murein hydrolase activator NlpD n=1 Tax=hydrothermal vent metagenome TaxID=652676 RepID=A0A3B1A1S9_9ZZZZ
MASLYQLKKRLWSIAVLFATLLLSGCGGHVYHVVEPGETLYSVSWLYGQDYRELAKWNGISTPYTVKSGQRLRVIPGGAVVAVKPAPQVTSSVRTTRANSMTEKPVVKIGADSQVSLKSSADNMGISWQWPTQGRVLHYFSHSKLNKGINIVAERGQPIRAAASGKVVYSGTGMVGMGKLIIVNHSTQYLSAYAHNDVNLVKEGQQVKQGELIARMGRSGADRVMLHFEIRREGKPVDPMKFLPGKK